MYGHVIENGVSEQLGKIGLDKATGADDLPIEAVKILAKQDIMYVVEAMNQVLQQGIRAETILCVVYRCYLSQPRLY